MLWQERLFLLACVLAGSMLAVGCTSLAGRRDAQTTEPSRQPADSSTSEIDQVSHEVPATADEDEVDENREDPPLTWRDFSYDNIGTTVRRLTGRGPDRNVARTLYGEGEDLYREAFEAHQKDKTADVSDTFLEASDKFAEAGGRWPDSALEEDALFRAGESCFFSDHYVKANDYFEQLIKKYPNTRYLDLVGARRFLIAKYWLDLNAEPGFHGIGINLTDDRIPWSDTYGNAIRIYDRMRLDDPTGKLADDATIAAGNASFAKGDFEKADQYFSDVRTHFPSSEHQFHAHYLGIQSKLLGYRGANYTGNSLEETEKLIRQVRRQFPQDVRGKQSDIDKAARETHYLLAEREWHMARFYLRRKENGAAQLYLETILRDYGDTPFAEKARAEAEAMQDQPLVPPDRWSWLVRLFPDSNSIKPLGPVGADGSSSE